MTNLKRKSSQNHNKRWRAFEPPLPNRFCLQIWILSSWMILWMLWKRGKCYLEKWWFSKVWFFHCWECCDSMIEGRLMKIVHKKKKSPVDEYCHSLIPIFSIAIDCSFSVVHCFCFHWLFLRHSIPNSIDDPGDFFYVIGSGEFDVWKKQNGESEPKRVFSYRDNGCFGELALMYNCPRAATVKVVMSVDWTGWAHKGVDIQSLKQPSYEKQSHPHPHPHTQQAVTPGTLWSVDRATFRHIIIEANSKQRKLYECFLENVPLLGERDGCLYSIPCSFSIGIIQYSRV